MSDPFGYKAQFGYYTDNETGLQLLTYRYYDPSKGRFLTRDPIGYVGGQDLYTYVSNDPVSWVDPLGLQKQLRLPRNPSGLGPEWQRDPTHRNPNGSRWKGPDGDYLDFHKGRPGVPGWRGRDHWHHNGGKEHYTPGDEVEVPDPAELQDCSWSFPTITPPTAEQAQVAAGVLSAGTIVVIIVIIVLLPVGA